MTVAPAAMSPKVQLSTWFGAAPLMVQLPWPLYAGSIVQLTPSPAGSGSFSVTFLAAPVPSAPLLPTVIAKPIESPALTVSAFAVLVTVKDGAWTTMHALSCTVGELLADANAVLGSRNPVSEHMPEFVAV